MTDPRPLSLVEFSDENLPEAYRGQYPFSYHQRYLYIGEVANMEGHCIVVDIKTSKLHVGYHTELFKEITE